MKTPSGILGLILLLTFAACAPESEQETAEAERPPNIVLIITDDQGYGDLGFHGNPDIHTPVLDSLARRSTRFPFFYVSPVCAPTRSSLMTGRYSLRTGVYDTYNGGAMMAAEETTLAELLQDAGYTTGIFGKWHLGDAYPFRPKDQGFTESLIHPSGGMGQVGDVYNYFEYDRSYFDPTLLHNGETVETQGYCSDVFTDGALDFIEANKEHPFFLYLSFNAPHTPLQLPEDYEQQYADLTFDPATYPQQGRPFPDMSEDDIDDARRVYGMVTNIDDNVGRVWNQLDRLNLTENTLLIFMTDNGPQQVRYTGGLRGRKGTVYEGGIRVPFFMHWPGHLPEDHEVEVYAAHIDLVPTLLQVANLSTPDDLNLDGHNLMPAIKGTPVAWADRPLFFYWQRGIPEPYRNVAVRKGPYKLVGHTAYDATAEDFELFDIARDPYEQTNLNASHPDVVADLKQTFDRWYEEVLRSPHLGTQRIRLGTTHENPVILNRNDARGTRGIWAQEKIYGYWDVAVEEAGRYDVTFRFERNLPGEGQMTLKVGTTQRTLVNADTTTNLIKMTNVPFQKGDHLFESWYWHRGATYLPFYVEVERKLD